MSDQNQTETRNQGPIKRIPYDKVTASIWEKQTADGRLFYTTTFAKSYRDKNTGEWKSSNSFSLAEMSEIPLLIKQVSPHIQMLKDQNREVVRPHVQVDPQMSGLATQRDAVMANAKSPSVSTDQPTQSRMPEL